MLAFSGMQKLTIIIEGSNRKGKNKKNVRRNEGVQQRGEGTTLHKDYHPL